MESCLREDSVPDLPFSKSESSNTLLNNTKTGIKFKKFDNNYNSYVNYRFNGYIYKEDRENIRLLDNSCYLSRKANKKVRIRSFFGCIIHFLILFIILKLLYTRTDKKNLSKGNLGSTEIKIFSIPIFSYVKCFETMDITDKESLELNEYSQQQVYDLSVTVEVTENKDQLVTAKHAVVEKLDVPTNLEQLSLVVLDTEGLAYRTDFSKKLIWATRLTEDLLRVKKPVSTRQETCTLEDIYPDNLDKNKTTGRQIFCKNAISDVNREKENKQDEKPKNRNREHKDNKENDNKNKGLDKDKEKEESSRTKYDYSFERLKSHLVPSYDGYVYYVDDFNTKLLQVHVKDIVNYTPFYTPLLEGVYLEGSRNSLVIALDYETGTYITRHNREDDSKNNYLLNYFANDSNNDQLQVGVTNWSVKAYTEKDHKQIWDFDWLEVGSVMTQNRFNETIIQKIKNSITVSSNRLFFNYNLTNDNNNEQVNHLVFPFPIAAVFAVFKSHREGIYTLDLVERLQIPPPPSFLYGASVSSILTSSRKITHKSLYVENGVIGVLDDPKLVTLVDENTMISKRIPNSKKINKRIVNKGNRLLLDDGKNKNKQYSHNQYGQNQQIKQVQQNQQMKPINKNIGIGVDEKGIIMIGSSLVSDMRMSRKERTAEFLLRWWWLLISWVLVMIATPFYWALTKFKKSRKKLQNQIQSKNIVTTEITPSSRTELYDSKTDLYDSSDESNIEQDIDYMRRRRYKNLDDDFDLSDMSIERKMSIDEKLDNEISNEIRRVRSEGNFDYSVNEDFAESVWMEEQSLINVFTNNQFNKSKKKTKLYKQATIQYPTSNNTNIHVKTTIVNTQIGNTTNTNGTTTPSDNNRNKRIDKDKDRIGMIEDDKDDNKENDNKNKGLDKDKFKEDKDKEKEEVSLSVIPSGSPLSRFLENGRFLRTFECIKMLGKGGFGSVYRACHKLEPGNPIYAVKFVLLKLKSSEDLSSRRYFREVAANRDIYSKYVVRYYTWWCEEPHFLPLAQMSNQLQIAAINNLRYLIQNDILPSDLIDPNHSYENKQDEKNEKEDKKNKWLNNYIKQYRDIIYQCIQDPKKDEEFPTFSQIAQKNKNNNNVKFLSSLNINGEGNNNLDIYSENSNILFKDTSNMDDDENNNKNKGLDKKQENEVERNKDFRQKLKHKLSIINEYENDRFNENKQYQVVLLILMEMCNGLTLREWLNRNDRRNKEGDKKIEFLLFKQIIKGLRDIHRNCFIHRDLKPENIFVDDRNNLKIGDLGLVGFIQEDNDSTYQPVNTVKQHLLSDATQVSVRGQVIGTPGYTAPEGGGNCTEKVDIYSAALILLELLCPRFTTVMERLETLEKFRKNHEVPPFIRERYRPWYDLMLQMADANPEKRPSAEQVYRQLKVILNS